MKKYDEIIRLFEQTRDNADELIKFFEKLQEEEKETKNESFIRWRKYPEEKPKKREIYLCAMKNPDNNYKWIEQFSYNTENDVWFSDDHVSSVDQIYGFAPCMWAEIDFPDLEEENG